MKKNDSGNYPKVASIGVYGYNEDAFYKALLGANVDLFCDIRMRRGMRGSEYAFVNSTYLQNRLSDLGIKYLHIKELAPSNEIRELQKIDDAEQGQLKSTRRELGNVFKSEYEHRCLDRFDLKHFLSSMPASINKVAFFCVEREPRACHRSLVTDKISQELGLAVEHLLP